MFFTVSSRMPTTAMEMIVAMARGERLSPSRVSFPVAFEHYERFSSCICSDIDEPLPRSTFKVQRQVLNRTGTL